MEIDEQPFITQPRSARLSGEFKFQKPGEVRTRFAPAPTGFLHIGATRTALFNYLFAKKYEGVFVLRIEDTDKERSKPEYEKDIIESLKWLGIEWSEGPDIGGDYGPYRQSQRLKIYAKYLEKLLAENKAYYCFCSEEELEEQRQYQLSRGEAPRYSGKCANLSKEEVQKLRVAGKSAVIRFKMPAKKIQFNDLIRGNVEFETSLIGDIVIARPTSLAGRAPKEENKNLAIPLYNFACVVDDFETKISHVIRGEEHISNTPKQISLQEALSFPSPQYAHLPIILAPDRTKLSKRHGATGVLEYRKEGYLPEAIVNFMAFLGWNPGGEREIYSMPSLVKEFSIEKVQKGGAVFNIKRLDFLNGFYIRQRSVEKLTELCLPFLIEAGLINPIFKTQQYPPAYGVSEIMQTYKIAETGEETNLESLQKIISIYQERLKKMSEISELIDFFFRDKLDYEKNLLKWSEMSDKDIKFNLDKSEKILAKIKNDAWTKENLESQIMPEADKIGDRGYLLWPFRIALTGKNASAGPFEIAEILGKEKTIKRIREALSKISK